MDASTGSKGKALGTLFVVALLILVGILFMRLRSTQNKLMELSMQYEQGGGDQAQNEEAAREVIEQVSEHYVLPEGVEPTVATIVDVNQLRARNAFYNKAKNGDHLIVTQDRAILYDPVADKIIDVVPVQIQQPAEQGAAAAQ